MIGERLQVLNDSGKMEFVARAAEASQTHALETVVGLEVGKAHLDPLSLIAGLIELGRALERTCIIAGLFVHVARHLAPRLTRTAFLLERARPAIDLACTIDPGVGFGDAVPFVL